MTATDDERLDDFLKAAKAFRRSAGQVKKVLQTERQACAAHKPALSEALAQLKHDILEIEEAFSVEKPAK